MEWKEKLLSASIFILILHKQEQTEDPEVHTQLQMVRENHKPALIVATHDLDIDPILFSGIDHELIRVDNFYEAQRKIADILAESAVHDQKAWRVITRNLNDPNCDATDTMMMDSDGKFKEIN